MNSAPIIIHGPPASGKTTHAEALKAHFGATRIIDEWAGQKLLPGDLALTNDTAAVRSYGPKPDILVLSIASALEILDAAKPRRSSPSFLRSRLDAGETFNAYERGDGSGWYIGLGPVTDFFCLATVIYPEVAVHLVAVLRAAHDQPPALSTTCGEPS